MKITKKMELAVSYSVMGSHTRFATKENTVKHMFSVSIYSMQNESED